MILPVAVFLSTLGFAAWIIGAVIDDPGLAVIGGVLVVGVGAMITTGSLEYRSGETETNVSANETQISYEYASADTPERLPLGALVMLLGALFTFHGLNPEGR